MKEKETSYQVEWGVFKIYLLQNDSIKTFYQNCLNQELQQVETAKNLETKWRIVRGV